MISLPIPCPRCHREELVAVGGTEPKVKCQAVFRSVRPSDGGIADGQRLELGEQRTRRSGSGGHVDGQDQLDEPCGWEQSGDAFLESIGA